jgi:hypothetical protein
MQGQKVQEAHERMAQEERKIMLMNCKPKEECMRNLEALYLVKGLKKDRGVLTWSYKR